MATTRIVILKESANDGTLYFTGNLRRSDGITWTANPEGAKSFDNVDAAYDYLGISHNAGYALEIENVGGNLGQISNLLKIVKVASA